MCQVSFFIEGNFKTFCSRHKREKVDQVLTQRHKRGFALRKKFKDLSQHEIFKINECCILKSEFGDPFKSSKYYSKTFLDALKFEMQVYNRKTYERLKFNNCVQPTRVSTSVQSCSINQSSNSYVIQKFDLNFAYVSAILCPDFCLPSNSDVTHLVGDQANRYCQKIRNDRTKYVIVK